MKGLRYGGGGEVSDSNKQWKKHEMNEIPTNSVQEQR